MIPEGPKWAEDETRTWKREVTLAVLSLSFWSGESGSTDVKRWHLNRQVNIFSFLTYKSLWLWPLSSSGTSASSQRVSTAESITVSLSCDCAANPNFLISCYVCVYVCVKTFSYSPNYSESKEQVREEDLSLVSVFSATDTLRRPIVCKDCRMTKCSENMVILFCI